MRGIGSPEQRRAELDEQFAIRTAEDVAKELGEMSIRACAGSLATLGLDTSRLDPLVDEEGGIAAFLAAADDGQILFI